MKQIDLNKSLYELTEEHPELISVLVGIGFAGVAVPEMRSSHGKVMTIPDGCDKFGLELEEVLTILKDKGFEAMTNGLAGGG